MASREPTCRDSPTWRTVWRSPTGYPLRVEEAELGGPGVGRLVHRVRSAGSPHFPGAGAVVVAWRPVDAVQVLLVRVRRVLVERTLWELPRGGVEPTDVDLVDSARRELLEETGVVAEQFSDLGLIYPDSGLLADGVAVVLAEVDPRATCGAGDGEVELCRWVDVSELRALVDEGSLRDGISLSALYLAEPHLSLERGGGGAAGGEDVEDEDDSGVNMSKPSATRPRGGPGGTGPVVG